MLEIDEKILLAVNGWSGIPLADELMVFASSKWAWVPLYVVLFFVLYRQIGQQRLWWFLLAVGMMIVLTDQGSVVFFKEVFHRVRPCHDQQLMLTLNLVSGKCGGQFGFVSSHSANVFALAVLIWNVLKENGSAWFGMFVWAGAVSISRVYLGVHFPSDIFVGGLYGCTVGYLVFKLINPVIVQQT